MLGPCGLLRIINTIVQICPVLHLDRIINSEFIQQTIFHSVGQKDEEEHNSVHTKLAVCLLFTTIVLAPLFVF